MKHPRSGDGRRDEENQNKFVMHCCSHHKAVKKGSRCWSSRGAKTKGDTPFADFIAGCGGGRAILERS